MTVCPIFRAFRERAQCIVDQYSGYKIEEVGLYLSGRMTQGENIADNGGLKQSFRVSETDILWTLWRSDVPLYIHMFCLISGLQEVGAEARRGARIAGIEPEPRPAVLPQLRANLVRTNAARRCDYEDPIVGAFPRDNSGHWAVIEFERFRKGVQLSPRKSHEPKKEVQCMVRRWGE